MGGSGNVVTDQMVEVAVDSGIALLDRPEGKEEEEDMVSIEVTEYSEVEELVVPRMQVLAQHSAKFFTTQTAGKGVLALAAAVLLYTLGLAVKRTQEKSNTPAAQRKRQVGKNKLLVDAINKSMPDKLTPAVFRSLCKKSGHTPVEVFRKYLWYLLQARKFDQSAVDDMITLKGVAEDAMRKLKVLHVNWQGGLQDAMSPLEGSYMST
eukprot:gene27449-4751_t